MPTAKKAGRCRPASGFRRSRVVLHDRIKNLAEERRSVYMANWNRRVETQIPVQFNMTLEKDAVAGELFETRKL
jgi:hypothetical protein